jgi:hypothetical protein
MISRLSLAAGATLLAAPAFAGGFTPAVATPVPVAPAPIITPAAPVTPVSTGSDWTGFYVGGQLGYGNLTIDDDADTFADEDFDGAIYGLHAGYMRDFGRFVLGAEVDFDGTQIEVGEGDAAVEVGSVVRGKLRAGYDAGRFLPYVTAGFAQARLNSEDDATDAALDDKYDGHFYGIGAAYQVNDRFMVGAEVLRHNFEDTPIANFDTDVTTVTLRGSIRF